MTDRPRVPLFTWPQWVILFVIIPLWVIQFGYTIAAYRAPSGFTPWTRIDFSSYYVTSERVLKGASEVYCRIFTPEETTLRGVETLLVREPTNPPLLTLALTPLAYGDIFDAWLSYTLLGVSLLLAALWFAMRECEGFASTGARLRLLLLVTLSAPMVNLLRFSQVQGWILTLILWAWILAPKYQPLSGLLLGLSVPIKIFTAPILAFMFVIRDYRTFRYALGAVILGFVAPQLIDPRLDISHFLRCGAAHVSAWAIMDEGNQSLSSLFRTIAYLTLIPLNIAEPQSVKIATHYGGILLWIASGFLAGFVFRNRKDPRQGLPAIVAWSTLCGPLAWPHYFLLTWPYLIQQWHRLSLGTRLIVWFSFPLFPVSLVDGKSMNWFAILTHPEVNLLMWLPGTVFVVQLALISYQDIARSNRSAVDGEQLSRRST